MGKWHSQEKPFSCGPSALKNCLIHLKMDRSESYLRFLMGTNKNGTSEKGIIKALGLLKLNYKVTQTKSFETFRKRLIKNLKSGRPCILLIESGTHWVAAIDYYRTVKIIDSEFKRSIDRTFKFSELKNLCFIYDKFINKGYYYFISLSK
jgi:ABC-type bacteriocin/lantibiotic exporter with double-glycine peptidase domain